MKFLVAEQLKTGSCSTSRNSARSGPISKIRGALRYERLYNFCFHGQAVRRSWERGIAKNHDGNGGTRRAPLKHTRQKATAV